ncbi:DUF2335 domain-containing protein [Fusobacterium necrophorum]|uniref:Membrane protein, PF10097 family n=1 Tax=Fusobacterium necrophorum subsp. funduliforme Fnf 1007 TaxID=1161424 RepID=A0AAN3VWZ8_9FUSO|nr:DUF2335 domain-containing protein [Fusobacterium necrophorum]EJU18692.1 membrane protein, PF10097 family [Fusobacterium necrophorum subsp. funduliforme Fnf 1007]
MVRKQKNPPLTNKPPHSIENQVVSVREEYEGILPHPRIIEGYEKNCPGAADRILSMVVEETKHRQKLEEREQENIHDCRKHVLKEEIKFNLRGQLYGFIILMTCLIFGFYLVIIGKNLGGYGTIVSSIILAVASVVYKKKHQNNDNEYIE